MRRALRALLLLPPALAGLAAGPTVGSAAWAAEPLQVLQGRIVRALEVHPDEPDRVLVGLKGAAPGSALVLESRDRGRSWAMLNAGRPLAPEASDVQALAYGPDGLILAGTWKHGLFRSRDDGRSFARDSRFPVVDLRDIRLLRGRPPAILAATGTAGVLRSDDDGASWRALGPDKTYVWSIALSRPSEAALYAASPSSGVFGSIDGGETWYRLFAEEGVYALDASDYGTDSFVVAGETGIHVSAGGKEWLRLPTGDPEKLSSILGLRGEAFLVGSWEDGVMILGPDGPLGERLLPGVPVIHLARAAADLLVGTWGQGLYIYPDWFATP